MAVVLAWVLIFMTLLVVLVVMDAVAAARQPGAPWTPAPALVLASTTVWLVYAGLYQHETPCNGMTTGCPTVYGYAAPLPDEHAAGIVLILVGFAVPALWVGWRRLASPLATGASLAVGPTVLAWWTAPRGDNDGLWILVFLSLPMLGGLAAVLAAVAGRVAEHVGRENPGHDVAVNELTNARPADRLAALAIDLVLVSAVLVVPLTALAHAKFEVVAAILGIGAATAYLAVPLARKGRTVGQSLVGLSVVDAATGRPVPAARAIVRSTVVVLEVIAVPTTIFAIPALVELFSLARSGRTVTDRLLGTVVLSERRPTDRTPAPAASDPP